jgi:hypothetical protein
MQEEQVIYCRKCGQDNLIVVNRLSNCVELAGYPSNFHTI